jgi:predicted helicase
MTRGNIHTLANMRAPEPFLTLTQRAVFSCQGKPTVAPLDAWIRQVEGCATTKEKGDHFEELCVAYLLHPRGGGRAGIVQAWTLSDLPEPVRAALGLPKRDYGIDIVALDARGKFHAVQAKFKGRSGFRPSRYRRALQVTWKELSTFYALARRGPYDTHWVITTADSVSRAGGVCEQDRSVCYRGLKAMPQEFWNDLAQMHGNRLTDEAPAAAPTPEEVRAIRLARFAPAAAGPPKKDGEAVDYDAIWEELGF